MPSIWDSLQRSIRPHTGRDLMDDPKRTERIYIPGFGEALPSAVTGMGDIYAEGDKLRQDIDERNTRKRIGGLMQREGGAITPANRKQLMGMLTEIGKGPSADALLDDPAADQANALERIRETGRQARLTVGERQGDSDSGSMASLYSAVRGSRAMETIDDLLQDTDWTNTGVVGVGGALIPGTPQSDYKAKLQTLGSQIAQQELAQMREASKTGGAVGQVSNFEQEMFMNALAPIQQWQSPGAARAGLEKAKQALSRYQRAVLMKAQGLDDATILSSIYSRQGLPAAGSDGGGFRILSVEE